MLADESDASQEAAHGRSPQNFGLTNLATTLLWKSNANRNSQVHYHYAAHAHVAPGGADPLESRGTASVASPDKL
jgi:hypothetical protein